MTEQEWQQTPQPAASQAPFDQELLAELTAAVRAILTTDKYKHLVDAAVVIPIYAEAIDPDKTLPGGVASVARTFNNPQDILRTLPVLTNFQQKFAAQHYTALANAAAGLVESKNAALQELAVLKTELAGEKAKAAVDKKLAESREAKLLEEHAQVVQNLEQQLQEQHKGRARRKKDESDAGD